MVHCLNLQEVCCEPCFDGFTVVRKQPGVKFFTNGIFNS